MPNTKSAIKAAKQAIKRQAKNVIKKDAYKKAVKEVRKFVKEAKFSEAATAIQKAYKALDKAAKTKVIHKNKASRIKSRIAKAVAKLKTA